MRVVKPELLEWKPGEGCSRALVHSEGSVQVEMLEIPSGCSLAPHKHSKRRELMCVVYSGGAQLRLGERVFRPIAGMTFEREPGEVMEVVNDTHHPLRLLITQLGYEASDVQPA